MTVCIFRAVLLGFLFTAALLDYQKGEIPLILAGAGVLVFAGMQLIFGERTILELALGLLPGGFLLLLSILTKQAVGPGDGAILLSAGVILGWLETLILLGISILFAALGSMALLILKLKKRKESIPFLPFLYTGYLCFLAFY